MYRAINNSIDYNPIHEMLSKSSKKFRYFSNFVPDHLITVWRNGTYTGARLLIEST